MKPQTDNWISIANEFNMKFSNCVGSIDGKHVVHQVHSKNIYSKSTHNWYIYLTIVINLIGICKQWIF